MTTFFRALFLAALLPTSLPTATAQLQDLAAQIAAAARTGGVVEARQDVSGFSVRVSVPKGRTLTLRAATPVTLDGGGADHGIKIHSGGRLVVEGPITFTNYRLTALFVTQAEGVHVRGVTVSRVGKTGILTGRTSNVLIEDCTVDATGASEHAIYLSEGGSNLTVRKNRLIGGRGCAIQTNFCPLRGRNLVVEDNLLGPAGNAAVNVSSVTGARIARNTITGTRQGIVLFSDIGGKRCRCVSVDLRQQVGPYNISRMSVDVLLPGQRRAAH